MKNFLSEPSKKHPSKRKVLSSLLTILMVFNVLMPLTIQTVSAEGGNTDVVLMSLTRDTATAAEEGNLFSADSGIFAGVSNLTIWSDNTQKNIGGTGRTPIVFNNAQTTGGWKPVSVAGINNADAFQIKFSTTGYENIRFSCSQKSTGSGPDAFLLAYSIGSPTGPYTEILLSETGGNGIPAITRIGNDTYAALQPSYDEFLLPVEMENEAEVYLRIVFNGLTTLGANGNTSINDILIIGNGEGGDVAPRSTGNIKITQFGIVDDGKRDPDPTSASEAYNHNFIEFGNPESFPVDITGWTVTSYEETSEERGEEPRTWAETEITLWGVVVPGGYFFLKGAPDTQPVANVVLNFVPGDEECNQYEVDFFANNGRSVLVLRNTSGDIVDAVRRGNEFLPPSVSEQDWQGNPLTGGGKHTIFFRNGMDDTNTGADWTSLNLRLEPHDDFQNVAAYLALGIRPDERFSVYSGNIPKPVDKTALNALIAQALLKNEEDYVPAKWTDFAEALGEAQVVSADNTAAQMAVNAARNKLQSAINALVLLSDYVEAINWPGSDTVTAWDTTAIFMQDGSGLDFHNDQLYVVNNKDGKFWVIDVAPDGALSFADGFSNGKMVKLKSNGSEPDSEGITVDDQGRVYFASERDNNRSNVNWNVILQVEDPFTPETVFTAAREWDITSLMPNVAANMGIEAVEWVSNADLAGKLFDENTNVPFDPANYPNATANGVFFTALEDNGHVYAFVLYDNETVVRIADIDTKLGGAMALDYDKEKGVLWVKADDTKRNLAAALTFTGEEKPEIIHVNPPGGLNAGGNYEGFAIAPSSYAVNGQRPVYFFEDGLTVRSLLIGGIASDYLLDPHIHNQKSVVIGSESPAGAGQFKRQISIVNFEPAEIEGLFIVVQFKLGSGENVSYMATCGKADLFNDVYFSSGVTEIRVWVANGVPYPISGEDGAVTYATAVVTR